MRLREVRRRRPFPASRCIGSGRRFMPRQSAPCPECQLYSRASIFAFDRLPELAGHEDLCPSVRPEHQEVLVTADEHIDTPGPNQTQHELVVGVAAGALGQPQMRQVPSSQRPAIFMRLRATKA